MNEAKEQRTRRWQRPREKTVSVRAREEGGRVQGAVLRSFASTKTNEQMKVRIVVPPEVPHDTRIRIEDLVHMEIDQLKDDEQKGKQPGSGTQEPVNKQPGIGTPEPVEMKANTQRQDQRWERRSVQYLLRKRRGKARSTRGLRRI